MVITFFHKNNMKTKLYKFISMLVLSITVFSPVIIPRTSHAQLGDIAKGVGTCLLSQYAGPLIDNILGGLGDLVGGRNLWYFGRIRY